MNNQSYHMDRANGYPDTLVSAAEVSEADMPITPLPNPGEGGPVDSGNNMDNGAGVPVIPLPNPGEGGPVDSGRPNFPPIFRPVFPGGTGGSVTVIPGITFPCYNCTATSFGRVRILNASTGYQPFYVYIGNWMVASGLANGDITSYVQAASGTQTITVSGANGYVYIQKPVQVRASSSMTIAIINTASGLDIMEISDISCNAPSGTSCLRTCNLSQNLGPFDVSIGNQNNSYVAFTNVRYREVTPYTSFYPGWYQLYIARTGAFPSTYLATAAANMSANNSYTLYIFNAPNATDGLRTMVVSN
ncbi:DUF4397 domain-containing protein [Enterocloster sp. OA13]|uniref:DUF4397 domain-containing protein n=1 Tax=Enterocloster hominis (ex Hitch et al. 2024) TaxID=1917870 RepID=A0ABV1D9Q3_9FIRM|nr:DUF4397 domain-containing protein [Lachnoclostridium pacaense]EEQ61611.1 hypothetical protein CBFG_05323 [Clostridiales bacterium 1_7_47FAA]MCD8170078.1 DUF4397 domain-containing protein [Clostridiales bacterium]MCH1949209.1 DUF4397 domain-containing protein [Enterocloster sp. OA13]RJW41134.1 DUF4397 domain-containing protein [Clostridiales bacterium TF09-2AC]MCC2817975.1 DUF4397 domain-containing protein [Lachnoclostridium pacaense]